MNRDDYAIVVVTVTGAKGKDGKDGKDGQNGKDGAKGDTGAPGKDGIVENLSFAQIQGTPADNTALSEYIEAKLTSMLNNLNDYEF